MADAHSTNGAHCRKCSGRAHYHYDAWPIVVLVLIYGPAMRPIEREFRPVHMLGRMPRGGWGRCESHFLLLLADVSWIESVLAESSPKTR